MGKDAFAAALKTDLAKAEVMKEEYFMAMPKVAPFLKKVKQVCRYRGYVKNFYGRYRRLKEDEVYKAPNSLIQGCAADYAKAQMIKIHKFLRFHNCKSRMLLFVHDELILEIHKSERWLLPEIRDIFSDLKTFRAPITAGMEQCKPNWGTKEDIELPAVVAVPKEVEEVFSKKLVEVF